MIDPTLTPASRRAVADYRAAARKAREDAALWDALADELEALGAPDGTPDPGQEALL